MTPAFNRGPVVDALRERLRIIGADALAREDDETLGACIGALSSPVHEVQLVDAVVRAARVEVAS